MADRAQIVELRESTQEGTYGTVRSVHPGQTEGPAEELRAEEDGCTTAGGGRIQDTSLQQRSTSYKCFSCYFLPHRRQNLNNAGAVNGHYEACGDEDSVLTTFQI